MANKWSFDLVEEGVRLTHLNSITKQQSDCGIVPATLPSKDLLNWVVENGVPGDFIFFRDVFIGQILPLVKGA